MKEYKLIKCYPGYDALGMIVIDKGGVYFPMLGGNGISKNNIENNPEFWEEIVEYPIGTKAYNSLLGNTYTKKEDGWYKDTATGYTDDAIRDYEYIEIIKEDTVKKDFEIIATKGDGSLDIGAVKRLSDGEVFAVGDYCNDKVIKIIQYVNNSLFIHWNSRRPGYLCCGGVISVSELVHDKPLFTTEDNVDIYEGDNIYFVKLSDWKIYYYGFVDKDIVRSKQIKDFSTKKAAQKYIDLNKPRYSEKEMMKARNIAYIFGAAGITLK